MNVNEYHVIAKNENFIAKMMIKANSLSECSKIAKEKFKEQYMLSNTDDIFVSIDTAYIRDTLNEILRTLQNEGV